MMTSMKAGNLDCIIVKDLSRLARERIGADELIQKTLRNIMCVLLQYRKGMIA